jgi:glycosyltransferase involved in cell wall biosynthesis
MNAPAVSVVIATRNYGRYLAGAIRSVLGQTWNDLELVIVDDGSTDDTPAVVQPFVADSRIHYHRTDGLGQSRAKNLGIELSRAPLIAFLDGDDEWLPQKLERQLPLFADPAVGVVYTQRVLMDEKGGEHATPQAAVARGRIDNDLLVTNPVCFSSVVVRRTVFETVGMFDPNLQLAIDYDLWLRVARHFEFDYVDEPLVRYRTGHANLSSRIVERIQTVLTILRRSLIRRRNNESADPKAVAEAWGSTCRTLGFVLRQKEMIKATTWYVQAARHDGKWKATARATLSGLFRRLV